MKRILRLFRDMKFRYKLILTIFLFALFRSCFLEAFRLHVFKMNPNSADKTTLELPFNRQEANWMQSSHGRKVRCVH